MRIFSVTSMKDEGPFLLEWIAYHRLIGVTDFLIFSNDCSDGTDTLLDALASAGVVEHRRQTVDPAKGAQWQALAAAWKHPARKAADWMLFSDVDEFPLVKTGARRLPDLIAALPEGADAVTLPWRLFGAAAVAGFADRPVTAQFTRCAPVPLLHPVAATFYKTLFRPQSFRAAGIHRPKRRKNAPLPCWVNGAGGPMPDWFAERDGRLSLLGMPEARSLAELHHYSLRSAESFIVKSLRGLANRKDKAVDLSYWVERNFNSEQNDAMAVWAGPLAAEIAELKALPGMGALHDAACDWHRMAFAQAMRGGEAYRLYCHCLHAAGSAPLPGPLAMRLFRMFGALE
ncbi:glycosyltransferase family 2 protein [Szabonella alba]|uniref:Glycosyltransferase family 2 protein n=1 Tax=Szabonella alba TaxID=2804194 RepID=A0A8K0XZ13_9RHOB|nr:glycosyltransferase family 2 protein [Szabonella alba]MBL4916635.1 glycosyltransferase family 2 protein [Szabonella alba]